MSTVLWKDWLAGLSVDTIGGAEKMAVLDGTTPKNITTDLMATYAISQLLAATSVTPATGDSLLAERSGARRRMTLDALSAYAVASGWSVANTASPALGTDVMLVQRSGTVVKISLSTLIDLANAANLDLTGLTAGTPGSTDLFLFGAGASPRKITLANLEAKLWTDFAAYVNGLAKVTTTAANDRFYCIQGGTPKYVTPAELAAYIVPNAGDTVAPLTTTPGKVPAWDTTAKTLTDGYTVVTSVRTIAGGAVDTAFATEQAVREAISTIGVDIVGATDIGAGLSDADLILVDDGADGTIRKSAISRVWTYITQKIQGLPSKTSPISADILTIQDSEDASILKELTVGDLWGSRYLTDMLSVSDVSSAAWVVDEDTMSSDSPTKVPTQQSVKAYVDNVAGVLGNFSGTADPTTGDDSVDGYSVGSLWVNLTTDQAFVCVDSSVGAAVWVSMTQAAAGWDGDLTDINWATGADVGADLAAGDQIVIADASDTNNPKRSAMSRVKTFARKQEIASYAANQTLTAAECNGYVIYMTGVGTLTLPAIADGMSVTVVTIGNVAVSIDPNAADRIVLDGVALDDGDKITNGSTAGDIAVLTYYSADGWHASTNGWTDGGA